MMLADMTPKMRRAALTALARELDRPRLARSATPARLTTSPGTGPATSHRWRCSVCGLRSTAYAAAERHADAARHPRIEVLP
jgi:hypothetical protein